MDILNEDEEMKDIIVQSRANSFPHPLTDDSTHPIIVFREWYFRIISSLIREKDNWWEKLENPRIKAKWIRQARKIYAAHHHKLTINKEDIEFVFKELRECYKLFGGAKIQPAIDCVWRSDALIPEELREELLKEVSILEDVPESEKDWHPGSDKQVLDLVHPSLYPLIYGRTLHIKSGKPILPFDPPGEWDEDGYYSAGDSPYSSQFQWLPSDFQVAEDGSTIIKSYINNLSREKHHGLYPVLEKIFSHFVPMFNNVLSEIRDGKSHLRRVRQPRECEPSSEGEVLKSPDDDDGDAGSGDEDDIKEGKKRSEYYDDSDEEEYDHRREDEEPEYWDMGILSGDRFSPPEWTEKLNDKTVKVIVKLANIVLTPENPVYLGGSWHVEGMLNERIVATGIYYYDQKNITESELRFRNLIDDLDDYMDNHPGGWFATKVLNIEWSGSSVQEVGYVSTKKNRSIVFPNIFQHRVSRFKLKDKSKPGFRKILVFFLCDPHASHHVISTSSVAPQQEAFLEQQVAAMRESHKLGNLPEDVFQAILKKIPPPISLKEAKVYREKLMDERKVFTKDSEKIQGISYSLCEH